MSEVTFAICDCCGHYCVKRLDTGRFEGEPTMRLMLDGIVMHVCTSGGPSGHGCTDVPHALRKLVERRKLIAEQNAAIDDPLAVRAPSRDPGCG